MKRILYIPYWMRLLTHLQMGEDYPSSSAKRLSITYSYILGIGKELKRKELITKTKVGRTNVWKLTSKGREVAKAARLLCEVCQRARR